MPQLNHPIYLYYCIYDTETYMYLPNGLIFRTLYFIDDSKASLPILTYMYKTENQITNIHITKQEIEVIINNLHLKKLADQMQFQKECLKE